MSKQHRLFVMDQSVHAKTSTKKTLKIYVFILVICLAMMIINILIIPAKKQEHRHVHLNITQTTHDFTEHGIVRIYHSSEWEALWLENINSWQKHGICEALQQQQDEIASFMNSTCSARTDSNWCLIDDSVHQFWYNTVDARIQVQKPPGILYISPIQAIFPTNRKIWSWFEINDTATGIITYEYIEPLVAHLRHPLAKCSFAENTDLLVLDRSYILPGFDKSKRSFLFDAGASSWYTGSGGPSLSYFASVWKRYGVDWDHIEAWEGSTIVSSFYQTVPNEWKPKITYHQQWISTSPDQTPFVPSVIQSKTRQSDFVVFKLDIDSKQVETAIVDYMLAWHNLNLIDEFVWEHHVDNYLMAHHWRSSQDMNKSIADSYSYFLKLRHKGVRAHSWI